MKPTYEELERQLEESRREFRAADATIHNLELKLTDMAVHLANAESKCRELAAESDKTSERMQQLIQIINNADNDYCMCGDAMKNHTHGVGITSPLKVRIECHMPDRRRRDLDNLQKAAFDALTKAGFWADDVQVVDYRVVKMPIVKGGRLELTITELESA